MTTAVERAIRDRTHLLCQAGTGTGKTLGYLVPVLSTGRRTVVATATKQLSEQIVDKDLPGLVQAVHPGGDRTVTYALLKGRGNYLCVAKVHELVELDSQAPVGNGDATLFPVPDQPSPKRPSRDRAAALSRVVRWADTTDTGDRAHAPTGADQVWDEVSVDAAGCPGASACPFGERCFAERARAKARAADVVVTNHALLAQDLRSPSPILGDRDVVVVDEGHEVETSLSSAWGYELNPFAVSRTVNAAARRLPGDRDGTQAKDVVKHAVDDLTALAEMLAALPGGLLPDLPDPVRGLLTTVAGRLATVADTLTRSAADSSVRPAAAAGRRGAAGKLAEAVDTIRMVAAAEEGWVRWVAAATPTRPTLLRVAPLRVGPMLIDRLKDRTLIVTSATLTVEGSFDPMVRALAFTAERPNPAGAVPLPPRPFHTVDVGTPFDYDRQAMLYIPRPGRFPEPVGRDRAAHTAAVLDDVGALARAAGGRTLALFTTTAGARQAGAYLRKMLPTPVLVQGDGPAGQLVHEFADREETVLCATMGFWHGVDVPGPSLSVVVMDKVPFAPGDDPLMSARRAAVDETGRNGFRDVYVTAAAVTLAQGVGRLIRTATDRGVAAVLDPRLWTKSYGPVILGSLPPMRVFSDREVVCAALTRLTATLGEPADPAGGRSRSRRRPQTVAGHGGHCAG